MISETKQTIIIERAANDAFTFTIDPANTPKWVDGVVKEITNETPTRLGTIYKNQDSVGNWAEFEITGFDPGVMFEMTKSGDDTHVRYTFRPLEQRRCELEYSVWVSNGNISERFSQANIRTILNKLKSVIEVRGAS